MSPLFSVIVPIFKVEKYIEKCVDSILSQNFRDFELLLIDDGSPDRCGAICDAYAAKDPRVRVVHKPNGGLVSARNTGIREAVGEYICYVDGDDWVAEILLETVYQKAIAPHRPDMVAYSAVKQFEDHAEQIPGTVPEGLYPKDKLRAEVYPYMMYDCRQPFCTGLIFPVAWNKIYRRELLLEHYCTEERIRMGEDNAFTFECLYAADTVFFCDDILYFYNQLNSDSMVHSYDVSRFENNQLLTAYIDAHLGGKEPYLDEQINAFKAYWLIMAVFHEVKSGRPLKVAAPHIREQIGRTGVLRGIHLAGLPLMAKAFMLLLNLRLYRLTLIASGIVNEKRNNTPDKRGAL